MERLNRGSALMSLGNGSIEHFGGSEASVALGRSELRHVRAKALRRGVWFRVLSGVERGMVNLVIRVVKGGIKSSVLARLVMGVVEKLREAVESRLVQMAREIGRPSALRLSRIAVAWGNRLASLWARDDTFIRYLTIMHMNSPGTFV